MTYLLRILSLIGISLISLDAYSATMRCPNGIVSTGDTLQIVFDKCGEPNSRERVNPAIDHYGHIVQGAAIIEHWTYQPTGGMSYYLRFVDGRLVQIRSQR